jgi:hypothetical protein
MSTISNYDETLPLPADVEREFRENAGDGLTALAWLADHGIDAAPEHAAVIQYAMAWDYDSERYWFIIYGPDHVGPKHEPELAVPIFENGKFIDLLFINESMSFVRATCRAKWLGTVAGPVLRLHAHPLDWIAAGGAGACHIEPISRKALKDLRNVATIECNDIHTALEAWDWGFGGEDDELARFVIDDTPGNISAYYEDEFKWRTASKERAL